MLSVPILNWRTNDIYHSLAETVKMHDSLIFVFPLYSDQEGTISAKNMLMSLSPEVLEGEFVAESQVIVDRMHGMTRS